MTTNLAWCWLDLETTGLDPDKDAILALGMILTPATGLAVAAEEADAVRPSLELAVWQPESVLEKMSPFVREMHRKGYADPSHKGLFLSTLQRSKGSNDNTADVQQKALKFLHSHGCPYKETLLVGSTISFDRAFLKRHMPVLEDYLHYRMIDVSTVKNLMRAWFPDAPKWEVKPEDKAHTPLADLKNSMQELAHYRRILRSEHHQPQHVISSVRPWWMHPSGR